MTDWREIASAPDGQKVDVWVWNVAGEEGEVDDGFRWPEVYVINEDGTAPFGLRVYRGEHDFGGDWQEYWPHENGQVVTHWSELPSAPPPPGIMYLTNPAGLAL